MSELATRRTVRSERRTVRVPAAPVSREGVVSRSALFGRLAEAERVVQISAPGGSGKTVLLRSWIAAAGLASRTAWVSVASEDRDPQGFWIAVANALRGTAAGSTLVRPLTGVPGLDGWAVVDRLLRDLASLEDRLWLVIDDAHLLGPGRVLAQILDLLRRPARAVPPRDGPTRWALRRGLAQQLTDSETRVLRYLPTHLTVQDIANELCLSVNTVSTHRRHLYAKLGVHTRHEAVDRARTLGLLAPPARRA
jgi:ATP/maltotriose-dependent transcriptional regulator MalT